MKRIIIKINCKKEKKENKNIKPFVQFYFSNIDIENKIKTIKITCPDEECRNSRRPDYFLVQPKIAVEVKGVYDKNWISRAASTNKNVERLQREINTIVRKENFKNTYLIEYSWGLRIKKGEEKKVAQEIVNSIRNNQYEFIINGVGEFKVVEKIGSKETKIFLAFSGHGGIIDSIGIISQNIKPKIVEVNEKFENFKKNSKEKINKNILLLVNKYIFGELNNFIAALSYSYNDLLKCENIDEIWLQNENINHQFYHYLLYKKDFLQSFDKCNFKTITEDEIYLFEKWFSPLSRLGDEYKEKLFIVLRQFLKDKNKKPYEVFENESIREEMVRLGEWLIENKKFDDTIWIIEKFIDDPDPQEPENYSGDPKFNYHKQIENGEYPIIITTVLGQLAWVISKLAQHQEYINKALEYTEKLLKHKNLYVKFQAVIPLIEIAARRQWLKGWGIRPRNSEYKKFHELVFSLLKLVKKNPNYKAIAKQLCYVFSYYKDLSTEEAEQVLDTLKITDESASLFIYFAIFRQRHYKDQNIEYNSQKLEEKLKEILQNQNDEYSQLQAKIVWYFWKILEQYKNEFETIKQYIDLVLEQPYQKDIHVNIAQIVSDWIEEQPSVCIQWYNKLMSKLFDFIKESRKSIPLWLMYTEEIIEEIARHEPNELIEIMGKLIFLWEKGAYIGDLKRLFESYKLVTDEKLKVEIKEKIKDFYNSMKKLHPKIENIGVE